MQYAGPNKRLIAGIIDGILSFAVFLLLGLIINRAGLERDWLVIVLLIAVLLYTPILCASSLQGTLGMRLLKLRMVNMDGNRISLKQSLIRAAVEIPLFLILAGGVIYMIVFMHMVQNDGQSQAIPDRVAKTLVIAG